MYELSTIYSVADCYDLLEIAAVNMHNRRVAERWHAAQGDKG